MELPRRIWRHARGLVAPSLCALAAVYFGYHTVQGQSGLIAYARTAMEIERVEAELLALKAERRRLAERAALLHPDHVDPDMLDQQVRRTLGLAHPDEVIVFAP